MKKTFILRKQDDLLPFVQYAQKFSLTKPVQIDISLYKKRRSLDQNAKMWAMLQDVSDQVEWHGERLSKESWKDMFTASLKRQKAVPGLDGGFVVLGARTSEMSTSDISDLIEIMNAFASEREVVWTDEQPS